MSTTVLLVRHERNDGDRLLAAGIEQARATGAALRAAGCDLAAALSSPQWRCVETIQRILEGGRFALGLAATDARLSDLTYDPVLPEGVRERIVRRAASLGIEKARVMLERTPSLQPHLRRRGLEAAAVLLDWIGRNEGATSLVCTHGGSRLEPMLCTLAGSSLRRPPYYFERGGMARLVFEDRVLRHHAYLGVVAEAPSNSLSPR